MFRKSILASTLSLLLLPGAGWALGLGGIRAESALNQPFAGEIDLIGADPEQLDSIKVVLASDAEYDKRGAERQAHQSKLRFRPQISPRGKAVVRVTSTEPIREPYMDFLVEVIWPKGRLVKGFTVLLDPPVTTRRAAPPVEPPAVRVDPTAVAAARTQAPTGLPAVTPPARAAGQPATPPAGAAEPALRYGPVKPGANLWRVAREMAPPGATVHQTAMALYRNNQQAFVRGNINRLKQGQVLQIPTMAEVFAMDAATAAQEFRAAVSGRRVTAAPLADTVAAPVAGESRLKIAGAAQPAATAPAEGQAAAPVGGAPTPSIEQELLLVRETGESTRQETDELRARVHQLEGRLADIQQVLTLRDAELARLQGAQVAAAGEPVVAGAPESGVGATEASTGGTRAAAEVATAAGPMPAGDTQTPPASGAPQPTEQVSPGATTAASDMAPSGLAASDAGDAGLIPGSARSDEPAPSWLDELPIVGGVLKSLPTPLLWAGLVGVPLLALLGWLSLRRRRAEEAFATAELEREAQLGLGSKTQPTRPFHTPGQGEPLRPEVDEALDLGSVSEEEDEGATDMVSEADIYIAYGRYRDAEDLLKQAIARFPRRTDLRYRLADVYAGARNQEGLAALMAEMQQSGMDEQQPEHWGRLVAQARMTPKAATPSSAPSPAAAAAAPSSVLGLGDLAFGGAAPGAGGPEHDLGPRRNVDRGQPVATPFGDIDSVAPEGADSLVMEFTRQQEPTFGLETLDLGPAVTTAQSAASARTHDQAYGSAREAEHRVEMDLDLSDLTPATELDLEDLGVLAPPPASPARTATDTGKTAPLVDSAQDFQFDPIIGLDSLPAVDSSEGSAPATEDLVQAWADPARQPGTGARGLGDGLGDTPLKVELDEADTLPSELFSSQWHIDAGAWDEAATKLDLGRAYVEMDDRQAAEALLREVVDEGNPEQQAEARELLAGIGTN